MRLQVGPNLGNNKVRLDFKQSPGKPDNTPSYEIEQTKADEFVSKYNDQSKFLLKATIASSIIGALIGLGISLKINASKLKSILGTIGGTLAGFGIGVGVSSYKKNSIMKEYDIKEI